VTATSLKHWKHTLAANNAVTTANDESMYINGIVGPHTKPTSTFVTVLASIFLNACGSIFDILMSASDLSQKRT